MEKARVIRQAEDERTFHIFYQLLAGCNAELRSKYLNRNCIYPITTEGLISANKKLEAIHYLNLHLFSEKFILEDPKNYTFLSHGQQTIPSLDDTEEFQLTWDAMRIMCISEEDIISICKVISGTLLFGNMVFKQERNSDQAVLPDDTVAQKVAHLFGINVNDMIKAFMRPRIKVGRDYVTKAQTKVNITMIILLCVYLKGLNFTPNSQMD